MTKGLTWFLALASIIHLIPAVILGIVMYTVLTEFGRQVLVFVSAEGALFIIAFVMSLVVLHRKNGHLLARTR